MRPSRTSTGDFAPRPGAGGFTLIELLLVMLLISLLTGLTVSSLARVAQSSKLDQAWRLVRQSLGDARVSAREASALARVLVVPGSPAQIVVRRGQDAGSWHFDEGQGSRALGGRNLHAQLRGASFSEEGTVRGGVAIGGGVVECGVSPLYDPVDGFAVALDIRPDEDLGAAGLASFGKTFVLELTEDGGLSATLDLEDEQDPVTVKTPPGLIARQRWARVELAYDGVEVFLRAHGVLEARKKIVSTTTQKSGVRLAAPREDDRLRFGSKTFKGSMDEIVYRTLEEAEVIELDPDVEVGVQAPLEVRFDGDGRLDPRVHEALVRIPLACEGETKEVTVDLAGVVR